MGLREYIVKRIVYMLILLYCVASFQFLIFNLMPGMTLEKYIAQGAGRKMSQEDIQRLRQAFGLDKPLIERYPIYIRSLFLWRFGTSSETSGPVVNEIMRRLPNTLVLMGVAEIAAMIVGILLGVVAAYKRGTKIDVSLVTGSLITYSVPVFWIGWIILFTFAVYLKWFPVGGSVPIEWGFNPPKNIFEYIMGRLWCITLPALTLFLFLFGGWILLARACVLETITEDYVITARAKGLKERHVLLKHVLKNASLPIITSVALAFGFLITGAIITENVFSYEGMGTLIWRAISTTDTPLLQAIFWVIAILVILANFIADLIYGVIDPRIKYG